MKKIIFAILIINATLGQKVQAQSPTENDIVGTWKVNKIRNQVDSNSVDNKATLKMLDTAFMNSHLVFKADKGFSFDIDFNDFRISNGHWKFNNVKKSIVIQEWKDKDTDNSILMTIYIKKEGDEIKYILDVMFLELELIKED